MAFTFNYATKRASLGAAVTVLDVPTLWSEAKVRQADSEGILYPPIAKASQADYGGGKKSGLTVELLDGWQCQFAAFGTPTVTTVDNGILIGGAAGQPLAYTTNVMPILNRPADAFQIATGGGGGSSLTADQVWSNGTAQQLVTQVGEMHDAMALDPAVPVEHREDGITAGAIQINHTTAPSGAVTAQRA